MSDLGIWWDLPEDAYCRVAFSQLGAWVLQSLEPQCSLREEVPLGTNTCSSLLVAPSCPSPCSGSSLPEMDLSIPQRWSPSTGMPTRYQIYCCARLFPRKQCSS